MVLKHTLPIRMTEYICHHCDFKTSNLLPAACDQSAVNVQRVYLHADFFYLSLDPLFFLVNAALSSVLYCSVICILFSPKLPLSDQGSLKFHLI